MDYPPSLINCENVSYKISGNTILENINMDVKQGETLTIIGPNGGGKTTLIKILIGILKCSSGLIIKAKGIVTGYMPQKVSFNSLIPLTVRDFLMLNAPAECINKFTDLVHKNNLARLLNRQLHDISGGEMQRVMLSKALLRDPNLIVLDEPTQALDLEGQMEFYKFLAQIKKDKRKTVVIISHELHTVVRTTDRVICLNKTILCSGEPEDVEKSGVYKKLFFIMRDNNIAYYTHKHKK